jgi:predicted extracellular nuclease
MGKIRFLMLLFISILISSCAILKAPVITKNSSLADYKYAFIPATNSLTSGTGATYGGQYYSSNKTVNPSDVIAGILMKEGFILVPEIKPELADKTVIVNYGESGRRNVVGGIGGYTIEVTINFVSAKTYEPVCSCTAEGQGSTEADDIRQAITRCLKGLLSE